MSTTEEELYAIERTKDFLYSLLDPKKTPKVPSKVRAQASRCLKHYPLIVDWFVINRYDTLNTKGNI